MKIDIIKLKNSIENIITIDTEVTFPIEQVKEAEILSLSKIDVKGEITKTSLDDYKVILSVKGIMVLPCALTLEPVDYPFNIEIDEIFSEESDEITKKIKKCENTIDILPIIWENILMEIPMKVVSPNASLENMEGNGWKLVTEDEEEINPELAKLKDLLNKKEV